MTPPLRYMEKPLTFVEQVLNGTVDSQAITGFVSTWHTTAGHTPLHQWLGFTWAEFRRWVQDPNSLEPILKTRKETRVMRCLGPGCMVLHLLFGRPPHPAGCRNCDEGGDPEWCPTPDLLCLTCGSSLAPNWTRVGPEPVDPGAFLIQLERKANWKARRP